MPSDPTTLIKILIQTDPTRHRLLKLVHTLHLPDCWIGGGFVRNAVWDHLHGRPPSPPKTDIDVIYFDASQLDRARDDALETLLHEAEPEFEWDVKNQARMHVKNGFAPFKDTEDGLRHWTDTATAVAVRICGGGDGELEVAAPFGVEDLVGLVVRPTEWFEGENAGVYRERIKTKRWLESWPLLRESTGFLEEKGDGGDEEGEAEIV